MERSPIVSAARSRGAIQVFLPTATIKCEGPRLFRSQVARDLACILDVSASVASWLCMPRALDFDEKHHVPDFEVLTAGGKRIYLDAPDRSSEVDVGKLVVASADVGRGYCLAESDEVYSGLRLRNAKDLLRYGDQQASLGDRIAMRRMRMGTGVDLRLRTGDRQRQGAAMRDPEVWRRVEQIVQGQFDRARSILIENRSALRRQRR